MENDQVLFSYTEFINLIKIILSKMLTYCPLLTGASALAAAGTKKILLLLQQENYLIYFNSRQ